MLSRWKKQRLRKFLKERVYFGSILAPVMPLVPLLRGRLLGMEQTMELVFEQAIEDAEAAAEEVDAEKDRIIAQMQALQGRLYDLSYRLEIDLAGVQDLEEELEILAFEAED